MELIGATREGGRGMAGLAGEREEEWGNPGGEQPGSRALTGFGSPAQDYAKPALDLDAVLVRDAMSTFAVRVSGSAMAEAGIDDGDVVLVDRSLRAHCGDVVVAVVEGELAIRRLVSWRGRAALRAGWDFGEVVPLTGGVRVWGVVTWALRRYRR